MKRIISTPDAPSAIGPYSQAVEKNGTLFISGQIAIDPATEELIDGDIREQTHRIFKNIAAILEIAGYNFRDIVKMTCALNDINNFSAMNEVYAEYFPVDPPARAALGVVALPKGADLEIECIAMR